jgi:homeobox protein YOX1/YHP1
VPQASSFYEHSRYSGQAYYAGYPARPGSSVAPDTHGLRAYPGANVSPPIAAQRDDRYQAGYSNSSMGTGNYDIYNPSSSYPGSAYSYYPSAHQSPSYSYAPAPDPRSNPQAAYMNPSHQAPARSVASATRPSRASRSHALSSPYARHPPSVPASLHAGSSHLPPAPQDEEPVIKKKRRRADANQLKVLNETYARTPFPSTEERQDLARRLDMSARSVQIWSAFPPRTPRLGRPDR